MQIDLFTCTAENERVDKSMYLSNRFVMEGVLKQESSVIDPVIIVEKSNPNEYNYNYMHIEAFNRWYFITEIISYRNNIWEIHAHVDVLYTYRAELQNTKAIIDKTQGYSAANLYMDDGSYVLESRKYNSVIPFESGLSQDGVYVLICAGGSGGATNAS